MIDFLRRKFINKCAYTLTEMLVVIAIIAITIGIATPAVTSLRRGMTYAQNNDYAKAIYLAAQSNLTQMRSLGELSMLEEASKNDDPACHINTYLYTSSKSANTTTYDLIVPNTLDPAIRNQQVIIEYHPRAGIVYSVFYYEGNKNLLDMYSSVTANKEIRGLEGKDQDRKKRGVGYYCVGSDDTLVLEEQSFTVFQASTNMDFANAQESTILLEVPIVDNTGSNMFPTAGNELYEHFISNLEITLTVIGENGGQYTQTITAENTSFAPDIVNNRISVRIPFDSLKNGFSQNANNQKADGTGNLISAGDNVTITAAVSFSPSNDSDPIIIFEDASLAGINPMFHSLTQNPDSNSTKPYILAVSNGRHLQNLTYLDRALASKIESIVFVQPESNQGVSPATTDFVLDWAETSSYYGNLNLTPIALSLGSTTPKIEGNGVEIRNLTVGSSVDNNAGLFAQLRDTEIRNITLADSNIIATDAESTGALIGTANNVKISNCTVSTSVGSSAISGKKNVGGLIGHTNGGTSITDCSTSAVVVGIESTSSNIGGLVGFADSNTSIANSITNAEVYGTDNIASNVGGLVGTAKASTLIRCSAQSSRIYSGENAFTDSTKNALGGLIGAAIPDGTLGTTISNCNSHEGTQVVSKTGSLSDLGGIVGYAHDATFTKCSSNAEASGTEGKNVTIPNNNLGGFVGRSEDSNYSDISVVINYLPQYAQDAGGFAALLYGGNVNNLEIVIEPCAYGAPTVNYFGGIASRCSKNAEITDVTVDSEAVINYAVNRAGGAFSTLGSQSKVTLSDIRIDIKEIVSEETAGFAVYTKSLVNISNSYFRGRITGSQKEAGFIYENSSNIRSCFANVDMDNGVAFVAANVENGSIKDCYGWVWGDGNKIEILDNCSYSYFVAAKDNAVTDLAFYESLNGNTSTKSNKITDTAALADIWAVELLNSGTTKVWKKVSEYPYPSLVGNSHMPADKYIKPVEGAYPYALRYEETYSDGSTGDAFVYFNSAGGIESTHISNLKDDIDITSTAYYLCHRTSDSITAEVYKNRNSTDFEAELENFALDGASGLFTIYRLTNDTNYSNLNLSTLYPLAYDNQQNQYYWLIRTAGQFANITKKPDGVFYLDRSLEVGTTLETFSGCLKTTANKSVTITTKQTLINTLTGSLIEINAIGLKAPLIGTIAGGKIANCTITANINSSNSYLGAVAGQMSSGTITGCTLDGSIAGADYIGGAVGIVTGGQVSGVSSDVAVQATGTNAGMFVGYASGGSFSDCHSTKSSTGLPFGVLATEEIQNVNYSSHKQLNNGALLYLSDFNSFSEVQENPKRVTVEISNCSITDGNGETKNALKEVNTHYYHVDKENIGYQAGSEYSVKLNDGISITYQALINEFGNNTNGETATSYYLKNDDGSYERLSVSITYNVPEPEEPEGTEGTGGTEGTEGTGVPEGTEAGIEATMLDVAAVDAVESSYTFKFYVASQQEALADVTISVGSEDLNSPVISNETLLYKISNSFNGITPGLYSLQVAADVLTYNGTNIILDQNGAFDWKNYLWDNKDNEWYNYGNSKITISITAIDSTSSDFTDLITITSSSIDGTSIATNQFKALSIALYYGYEYLGSSREVYYPS